MKAWFAIIFLIFISLAASSSIISEIQPKNEKVTVVWQKVSSLFTQRQKLVSDYLKIAESRYGNRPEVRNLKSAYLAVCNLPQTSCNPKTSSVSASELLQRQSELTVAISSILASENLFSDLMLDDSFKTLHIRIDETEANINAACSDYRKATQEYRLNRQGITHKIARIIGLQKVEPLDSFASNSERVKIVKVAME